jgi:hypothetical protein
MPPSYADKIADATTKKELIKYKELIEKSVYLKSKNLDSKLLKMIDDKMDSMNDNDMSSDDGRLSALADAAVEALPPSAKRPKIDELKLLIQKKATSEYYYYKNKANMEMHIKARDELKSQMDGFLINDDDVGDDMLTSLTSEVDRRIHNVKDAKKYADYWNLTYMIKECEIETKKYKKMLEESVKELDEYNKIN